MSAQNMLQMLLAMKAVEKENGIVTYGDVLEFLGEETRPEDFEEELEITNLGNNVLEHLNMDSNITIH